MSDPGSPIIKCLVGLLTYVRAKLGSTCSMPLPILILLLGLLFLSGYTYAVVGYASTAVTLSPAVPADVEIVCAATTQAAETASMVRYSANLGGPVSWLRKLCSIAVQGTIDLNSGLFARPPFEDLPFSPTRSFPNDMASIAPTLSIRGSYHSFLSLVDSVVPESMVPDICVADQPIPMVLGTVESESLTCSAQPISTIDVVPRSTVRSRSQSCPAGAVNCAAWGGEGVELSAVVDEATLQNIVQPCHNTSHLFSGLSSLSETSSDCALYQPFAPTRRPPVPEETLAALKLKAKIAALRRLTKN